MARVKIYDSIFRAVHIDGTLQEPFTVDEVRRFAPGLHYNRYYAYLTYNSASESEQKDALFLRVERGLYRLMRKAMPAGKGKSTHRPAASSAKSAIAYHGEFR